MRCSPTRRNRQGRAGGPWGLGSIHREMTGISGGGSREQRGALLAPLLETAVLRADVLPLRGAWALLRK
jgi:hypothetical protein